MSKYREYHKKWRDKNRSKLAGYARKYRDKYPDKAKLASRRSDLKKYGLTLDQYEEMLLVQKKCCRICGVHQDQLPQALHVDHCHLTNRVRALLCSSCNHLIGNSRENENILHAAIEYLRFFNLNK